VDNPFHPVLRLRSVPIVPVDETPDFHRLGHGIRCVFSGVRDCARAGR
jgi:hypothetical protein